MAQERFQVIRMVYDEPYSATCYKEVCAFGYCTDVPYPCVGLQRKEHIINLVAYWPDETTDVQKAILIDCATAAVPVALAAFNAAYAAASVGTGGIGGIVLGIGAGAIAAEEAGRSSFDTCKRRSDLPSDIANRSGVKIEQDKHNAFVPPQFFQYPPMALR